MRPAARTAAVLAVAALALAGCRGAEPAAGSAPTTAAAPTVPAPDGAAPPAGASPLDGFAELEASVSAVAEEVEQD